jgi:hypothetical protein
VIRISVEVGQGAARYRVAVRAKSIGRALEIVGRQNTGYQAKMTFPTYPKAFFVREAAMTARAVDREAA